jgi:subtilisin family serine protease
MIASTMAKQAAPGAIGSLFTSPSCPKVNGVEDIRCLQVDPTHAVSAGTSMSAPMVTGAVALLFQKNPMLTQSDVMMLLQAGAHPFRSAALFQDQGGPGELDVQGSLDALDQMQNPRLLLPVREKSWLTFSADYLAADESTPLTAIVELRTIDPAHPSEQPHRADLFDASRLVPYVLIDGQPSLAPDIVRRGPGVWYMTILLPRGRGGSSFTLGVRFDGVDVVDPRTLPIGTDIWTADYPSHAKGGCILARDERGAYSRWGMACAAIAIAFAVRRRARRP